MSIPSKITSDFYIQAIETFSKPFVQRAQISDMPCVWIADLEKEHVAISNQMQHGMEMAKTTADNLLKKLQPRMACIAAIGLGAGLGGFCAVVAGGGILSIAFGIIGALAGILAGVFIGLWAAKAESTRKMLAEYQEVFKLEADWIETKMENLDQQIALNGPDREQLSLLKIHFEKASQQQADLITASQKKNFFHQMDESLAPKADSSEAALLKTWNERNNPKPASTTVQKNLDKSTQSHR